MARPGDLGTDILHFNLHKTFSVPHGGGGPGAGATAVTAELARFLPQPVVCRDGATYRHDYERPQSIGRVRAFFGNVNNAVRGYAYLRSLGGDGLAEMSRLAVLNANYLRAALTSALELPYARICKHEAVFSAHQVARDHGVRTLDVAKRLIDYGIHPPTIYFPLTVPEALMIEPTETESKQTLDRFIAADAHHPRRSRRHAGSGPHGAPQHADRAPRRGNRGAASDPGLAAHRTNEG